MEPFARSTSTLTMLATLFTVRPKKTNFPRSPRTAFLTLVCLLPCIAGCFAYVSTTSDTTLAPRVVVDVKADRVWHFQNFEALDAVPEEQFLVPEMCTDDPVEPVPADGRRR
jgi:hypothetical protein